MRTGAGDPGPGHSHLVAAPGAACVGPSPGRAIGVVLAAGHAFMRRHLREEYLGPRVAARID